jgi:predicted permease
LLAREPAFAGTAVLTLAVGIGAATAIFSVLHAVLVKPLPYDRPEQLVHVLTDFPTRNVRDFPWSSPDFLELEENVRAFSAVAGLVTWRDTLVAPGEAAISLVMGAASPGLFQMLGVRTALGIDFNGIDVPNVDGNSPRPALLSHRFWMHRFGGDVSVMGGTVRLGDRTFEIIGILDPEFELLYPSGSDVERSPDVWMPLDLGPDESGRDGGYLRVLARLFDGVEFAEASAELDQFAAGLRSRFPSKASAGLTVRIESMHEQLVRDVRPLILSLMGAVVFVLLIASASVTNLLLVRLAGREREFGIRLALGGTRGRLAQQLVLENLVLASGGIVLGIALAAVSVKAFQAIGPANFPRLHSIAIDSEVVLFAAAMALVSTVVFGTLPVVRASSASAMGALRGAGRTSGLAQVSALRTIAAVTQVALALVLLVGAGLMFRSLVSLQRAEPGYDPEHLLTFLLPDLRLPDPDARRDFANGLQQRLRDLPNVEAVTAANPLPLDGRIGLARWGPEEALSDPSRFTQAAAHAVLPGYFGAMRTRVIQGREYAPADNRSDSRLLVIDRLLAASAFRGESAIGKTVVARINTPEPQRYEVIGVVEHQRHTDLARDGRGALFVVDAVYGHGIANRWAVRTTGDPMAIAAQARAIVSELNPRTGAIEIQPMTAFVAEAQAQTTFALVLIGIFAVVALVLAAVGLYSVLSTTVRQRTAEIGVRMAFGAGHASIFRMMVVQGLKLSAAGIVVGIGAALLLTGTLRTMLVGVEPTDPATFAAMVFGFLVIAAIACGLPALRASRLDPMVALRDE